MTQQLLIVSGAAKSAQAAQRPSNIHVDAVGTPLVADFGLAKRVDADRSPTERGVIVGTSRYMAPEQAAEQKEIKPRKH